MNTDSHGIVFALSEKQCLIKEETVFEKKYV